MNCQNCDSEKISFQYQDGDTTSQCGECNQVIENGTVTLQGKDKEERLNERGEKIYELQREIDSLIDEINEIDENFAESVFEVIAERLY